MNPNPAQSRQFQNSQQTKTVLFQTLSYLVAVFIVLCFILKDQIENLKIETSTRIFRSQYSRLHTIGI
jgi:hypothetical protein